MGPP
jgi:hypothetical protein